MSESQYGFSLRKLLSTVDFNPLPRFPDVGNQSGSNKSLERSAKQRCAPILIRLEKVGSDVMPSHISHARVKIRERRRIGKTPLYEEWTGTAEIDGEKKRFTTNHDELEAGEEYHVVFERTEIVPGESGIRIHDIIQ